MSISGIGSTPSFWQQDQNYWSEAQSNDNQTAATTSVINAIATAQTNLGKGLASIANQTALNRVNSQLSAAIQSILSGDTSSTSSNSTSSSPSSSSSGSSASPATGTGTALLSMSTPLSILGIPAGGSITVSAGGDTTTYASSGSDTVANLLGALNNDLVGNAAITASLSREGQLVLTSKNDTDTITVGGTYASNIGFGAGHQTFKPTAAAAASTSASSTASASNTSSASTSTASTSKTSGSTSGVPTLLSENISSAASILSDSGVGGTLVDMLA